MPYNDAEWDALVRAAYERVRQVDEMWDRVNRSIRAEQEIVRAGCIPPRQGGDQSEGFRETDRD